MEDIGAGLQISSNGWKVLQALGVTDGLEPLLFEPPTIDMKIGRSERDVWSLPMARVSRHRWKAPYVHVHRADLANVLAQRLEILAPGALRMNIKFSRYNIENKTTFFHFDDGSTETSDILIGADGLHSVIRAQMLGNDAPKYTGNMAWRATVPVDRLGDDVPPANTTVWVGKGRHAVTTRLHAGQTVNFVGMIERPEPSREGWRIKGQASDALRDFHDFCRPITKIIETATELNRWALFSRDPLPTWSDRAVIILGDAAHAMLPSMAQGAVQALEDAWTLAALLAQHSPERAGQMFYQTRIERTSRIQRDSAANARMFHRAGILGTPVYYGGMAVATRLAPELLLRRQAWVYEHDVVSDWPL